MLFAPAMLMAVSLSGASDRTRPVTAATPAASIDQQLAYAAWTSRDPDAIRTGSRAGVTVGSSR